MVPAIIASSIKISVSFFLKKMFSIVQSRIRQQRAGNTMHYPCAGSSVAAGQGIRAAAHCPRQAGVRFTDLSTSTCNLNMGAPLAPDDSISSPVRAVRPDCTWRDPCSDDSPVASSRAAHVGSCSVERNLAAARASVCSPRTSRRASGRLGDPRSSGEGNAPARSGRSGRASRPRPSRPSKAISHRRGAETSCFPSVT
jgi:hypothetical protein